MTDLPKVCFPLMSEGIDSAVPQYKVLQHNNYSKVPPIFFNSRWDGKEHIDLEKREEKK